jgi:acetyltransferase-like isoleucine patch superfamily enzyme
LELVFNTSVHHLDSLVDENEIPATSLKVLGKPLIIRNIDIATKVLDVDTIRIPDEYSDVSQLIHDNFPSINVKEFRGISKETNKENSNKDESTVTTTTTTTTTATTTKNIVIRGRKGMAHTTNDNSNNNIEIPINSLICHYSGKSGTGDNTTNGDIYRSNNDLIVYPIIYPWDFLNAVEMVLQGEVIQTSISPSASVAKSAIIKGPCIIEDNVTIDDFCKIIGPTYIGKGSFIGTSSLVRQCMIGANTKIGYSCEIGRTYFAGDDEIAHINVILDSIVGKNVWFGGYSRTANMFLNNREKNIIWKIGDGKSVDIGTYRFGSIFGNNCTIGTSVTFLPARYIPSNTVISDETTFGKNITVK